MKLEPDKLINDRYEVKELLGSGGMAIVHRAHDRVLGRSVTLKIMRDELKSGSDESVVDRFYKEAQAVASLSHENVVEIYDYGEDENLHFLVMEYIEGTTLKDLILKKAPLPDKQLLGVAIQIARGLCAAHKEGIVHRDIKPQNILVTRDGDVKITDFGIAQVTTDRTMTSTESMGSAHYFSPEQARGGYIDQKSDIYSLGIVMYEMATAALPFDGDTPVTIAVKHLNDPIPDPRDINPDISDDLCYTIFKATEKLTSRRYPNMAELLDDLLYLQNDLPLDYDDGSYTRKISEEERAEILENRENNENRENRIIELGPMREPFKRSGKRYGNSNDNPETNRKLLIAALSTSAVLIAVITFVAFWILRPQTATVPDVLNMTMEEAQEAATAGGFLVVEVEQLFNDDLEFGLIMRQEPEPDQVLDRGGNIHVTVSQGPEYIYLPPEIETMLGQEARDLLIGLDLDLRIVIESEYDSDFPTDIVLRIYPPIGEGITRGSEVTLFVNAWPENTVMMPNLISMTELAAVEILEQYGLVRGQVTRSPNLFFSEGRIFNQSINSGTPVQAGTAVEISISTGTALQPPAPTVQPAPDPTPEPPPPTPTPPAEPGAPLIPPVPGAPTQPDTSGQPGAPTQPGQQPAPPEQPAPPPPAVSRSQLTIAPWDGVHDAGMLNVRIYRIPEGGSTENVSNFSAAPAQFPLSVPIEGSGTVDYLIHIYSAEDGTEVRRFRQTYNFGG